MAGSTVFVLALIFRDCAVDKSVAETARKGGLRRAGEAGYRARQNDRQPLRLHD
jgi:hypothetical protein